MMAISATLVLAAACALVLGIVFSIPLVYAAIGLSVVAAAFSLIEVFQQPTQLPAGAAPDSGGSR